MENSVVPDIRDFVPEKLKPWLVVLFVLIFQISGGVYLAAVTEMVGSTALMQEDVMMAGYASLVGMSLTFCIMFRLKFRFPIKTGLLVCAFVLIVCNLICMQTISVPVLVATCFVAGLFRMWAIFFCNTTIQLWVTPKRVMSVWFCFIYLQVQGALQLNALFTAYIAFWAKWEFMHWFIVGLLLAVVLTVILCYRHYHSMMRLPLFGIDWFGGFLWGGFMMCVVFVCVYGNYYDWYQSVWIWLATIIGIVALCLNLWRASFIRHPYIDFLTLRCGAVWKMFALYILLDFLLAPEHVFEHAYFENILCYDSLNIASLNWWILLGVIVGSVFTYVTFARLQWRYRTMIILSFISVTVYLMVFYFIADYNVSKSAFYFPLFCRGFAYVICAITLLTSISQAGLPFPNFAQGLTLHGFGGAVLGGVVGSAVLGEIFERVFHRNMQWMGESIDRLNGCAQEMSFEEIFGALNKHALAVTIKEIYGLLTICSIFLVIAFLFYKSSLRPTAIHPKWRTVRRLFKRELKEDVEL